MKIYVAMHKKIDLGFKSDLYEPLLVGSYNKKDKDILRDDKGENISSKNENYCELTGVYWIWKNSKLDQCQPRPANRLWLLGRGPQLRRLQQPGSFHFEVRGYAGQAHHSADELRCPCGVRLFAAG